MSKDNIIKFLKFTEIAMLICVSLICVILVFLNDSNAMRYIIISLGVGAVIGGIIDIRIILPRNLKNKDERTMVMLLMAQLAACSFGFILLFLSFIFTAYNVVELTNKIEYAVLLIIITILTMIIEKVAYKIIDSRM